MNGQLRLIAEGVIAFARDVPAKEKGVKGFRSYQIPTSSDYGLGYATINDFTGQSHANEGDKVSWYVNVRGRVKGAYAELSYTFVSVAAGGDAAEKKTDKKVSV